MKSQYLITRIISIVLLAGILTGCSGITSGGGGSEVLASDLPRQEITELPLDEVNILATDNNGFAFDLYQQIQDQSGNLFFSPYSISAALAMTYAGARGDTAAEMAATLHFPLDQADLHSSFNALDQYLTSLAEKETRDDEGDPFQLSIANALWGQKDFHFEDAFLDTLAKNYGAGLRLLDYIQEPEESRVIINDWISEQTREKIQDLIPQGGINNMTRLVLSNAIYFKAAWQEEFEESLTEDGIFYSLDGDVQVPMMRLGTDAFFQYYQGEGFQVFEMPYVGGDTSMLVILPDQGVYQEYEDIFTLEALNEILAGMEYRSVFLTFPKFEFESELSLADTLVAMGMPLAFSDLADFSGMTGGKDLLISDVFHKAYVNVDEEGTEAAAATAVVMKATSAPADPLEIKVDRPFIFLIRENQTNSILFMGRVVSP